MISVSRRGWAVGWRLVGFWVWVELFFGGVVVEWISFAQFSRICSSCLREIGFEI